MPFVCLNHDTEFIKDNRFSSLLVISWPLYEGGKIDLIGIVFVSNSIICFDRRVN